MEQIRNRIQNKKTTICDRLHLCNLCVVRLRRPSAKQFWDGLERFGEQLEELGIGDED